MEAEPEAIREAVRQRYAARARQLPTLDVTACCTADGCDPITTGLYAPAETASLPEAAVQASLGCGSPTALASLQAGEVVLDLGSGGGIDVLLAAQRVGPTGYVYGLDMTEEMLRLARRNQTQQAVNNVTFLKGLIEAIPLPDAAVDVVISNCVVNLSADKGQVLREAFRVLRPGGRLAISDVVVRGELPAALRRDLESWAGCVAGALEEDEYRRLLAESGFEAIAMDVTRVHDSAQLAVSGGCCGTDGGCAAPSELAGQIVSAFVQARKPRAA
ncbi:MAG: arsenite methyltransferase [Chloroflexota bacterium]|jgi:SAM-dependent methyltransferase|nr:arsenite methyltransferase [Chloroflexota bacterium]